jgi:hypothetical protein
VKSLIASDHYLARFNQAALSMKPHKEQEMYATPHEIKLLVINALIKPTREQCAKSLERAYIHSLLATRSIQKAIPEDDRERINFYFQNWDAVGDKVDKWIEQAYPDLANALDATSEILEIFELKGYWRELGFSSWEAFDTGIEDENYLLCKIMEISSSAN